MRPVLLTRMLLVAWLLIGCSGVSADPLVQGDVPVDVCDSGRDPESCRPAPLSPEANAEERRIETGSVQITRSITLDEQPIGGSEACEVEFTISYYQAYDQVRVETEVANPTCVASHGEYALRVRTRNPAGEDQTRSFPESWSRETGGDLLLSTSYPMNGDDRLVWVMVNSKAATACTCD